MIALGNFCIQSRAKPLDAFLIFSLIFRFFLFFFNFSCNFLFIFLYLLVYILKIFSCIQLTGVAFFLCDKPKNVAFFHFPHVFTSSQVINAVEIMMMIAS